MWKQWFPKHKVPAKIGDLVRRGILIDRTHEADVTPHFEVVTQAWTIVLWVDHPEKKKRYLLDGPRYMVDLHRPEEMPETVIETERLEEALEVISGLMKEGKGLRLL